MNQSFYVISGEEKSVILNRLSNYLNEPVEKVEELYPVWEAIILGGLLKLVRNRIRFNALYNFILQKSAPIADIEAFLAETAQKYDEDAILRYGEGMMGILIPDKKSAIAMLLSREMGAKSSAILKGLTLFFGLYAIVQATNGYFESAVFAIFYSMILDGSPTSRALFNK